MMRDLETLCRGEWAVCDRRGVVADIIRLSPRRWSVECYHSGVTAFFRTRSQAFHFATFVL